MKNKKIYSLYDILVKLRNYFEDRRLKKWNFFVKAEINKLNHYPEWNCYPELIWKEWDKVVAKAYGFIPWYVYNKIQSKLKKFWKKLDDGMLVVFYWYLSFHEKNWLKFKIDDLDVESFLWSLEKQKQENIQKLKGLWIFEKNKEKVLPTLIKKIAVISVESWKGYNDFKHIIDSSPYKISYKLFPASMQWSKVVPTILKQLKNIDKDFDVVVILRWWGSDTELVEFNNFELAKAICEYELPVLSAIWHSTNKSVLEMVSNKSFITPSKLAEFIIQNYEYFDLKLKEAKNRLNYFLINLNKDLKEKEKNLMNFKRILANSSFLVQDKLKLLFHIKLQIVSSLQKLVYDKKKMLKDAKKKLINSVDYFLERKENELEKVKLKLENIDVLKYFEKGFVIVLKNWKMLKTFKWLKKWDILEIQSKDGKFKVKVI